MKLTVVVCAPPSSQAAYTAWRYCRAALDLGHSIYRLFFYQDGAHNASRLSVTPQGDFDLPAHWDHLIEENEIDAIACISSALRRGIINAEEAERYEREGDSLSTSMSLSGLGQLVEAGMISDRVITFGG